MGVQWIEHKGQRIAYVDFRGMSAEELLQNEEVITFAKSIQGKARILVNYEGCVISTDVMEAGKQAGKDFFEPVSEKTAIVGIHGIRHILLQAYNWYTGAGENQRLFDTEEEALDWLAS